MALAESVILIGPMEGQMPVSFTGAPSESFALCPPDQMIILISSRMAICPAQMSGVGLISIDTLHIVTEQTNHKLGSSVEVEYFVAHFRCSLTQYLILMILSPSGSNLSLRILECAPIVITIFHAYIL